MSSLRSLFGLAICLATVFAAGNVCNKQTNVNRPANNQPYYWPPTWNENQTAPAFEKEQSCTWRVSVPSGYYARLIMNGQASDGHTKFQTIDSAGNIVETSNEGMEPYFFPSLRFILEVNNEAATTFGFKVQWFQLPTISRNQGVGSIEQLINITQSVSSIAYSANPLSLMAFPANVSNHFSLRSVMIYNGFDYNSEYVGSLYNLYQTPGQYLAGNVLVIANVEASQYQDQLLIQDGSHTKDIAQYVKFIPDGSGKSVIQLTGGQQKSAIVTVTNLNQTITAVDVADSAQISFYYGTPSPFNLYKQYTGFTLKAALPLAVQGGGTQQWVLNSGNGTFTFEY